MDTLKLCFNVTLYNSPYYALQYLLKKLKTQINHLNFNLNKYAWDGKKPYNPNHSDHVSRLRHLKAVTLLSIRQTKKALRGMK
jgi:hypothetical protein